LRNTKLLERVPHLKVSIIGLRAFNQVQEFVKPTTRFIQVFGRLATKRVHSIDREQLEALLNGEILPASSDEQDGYIILSFRDQPIGLGLLIKGRIRSQLPRRDFLFIKGQFSD
jgi:NOL1/NOP2/fmu family ribosome biogenesis protein